MSYRQLSKEQRLVLGTLLETGMYQKDIAEKIGVDPSTISRELSRNRTFPDSSYAPRGAHRGTQARRRKPAKQLVTDTALQQYVVDKLIHYWSPEQIAGRLARERNERAISHETIYRWIYCERRDLIPFLRLARKRRYRRRSGTTLRVQRREEAQKQRIDARPAIVEARSRIGDWEGDTIVGQEKTIHILTHVDRKSGLLLADKAAHATAREIRTLTAKRFNTIPKKKRCTITYDNGVQFSEHEETAHDLAIPIYFAYPYHSWERGTNENTNGLLRQFFPKGSSFAMITQQQIDRKVKLINHRPRKRHCYLTPYEVFNGNCT